MKIFQNKKKHASGLKGYDGVFFNIRKMTEGRRNDLKLATAELHKQLRENQAKVAMILENEPEDVLVENLQPENKKNFLDAVSEKDQIISDIKREWLKVGLISIEGLQDEDGKKLDTAELLINEGPEELYEEIVKKIQDEATLSDEQAKN